MSSLVNLGGVSSSAGAPQPQPEISEEESQYQALIKQAKEQEGIDKISEAYLQYSGFLNRNGRSDEALFYIEQASLFHQLLIPSVQKGPLLSSTSQEVGVHEGIVGEITSATSVLTSLPNLALVPSFFPQQHTPISRKILSQQEKETGSALSGKAYQLLEQFMSTKVISLADLYKLVAFLSLIDNLDLHRQATNAILQKLNLGENSLLDFKLLWGLSVLLQSRPNLTQDTQFAGDYAQLLEALLGRLKKIQISQNLLQVQALLQTVSLLLEQMVDAEVKGIDHEAIHKALTEIFERLRKDPELEKDAELSWQIKYAEQALARLPTNKDLWDKLELHYQPLAAGSVLGAAGILKIAALFIVNPAAGLSEVVLKALDPAKFIGAFTNIKQGLTGLFPKRPNAWYDQLRTLDVLLAAGLASGQLGSIESVLNDDSQTAYDQKFLFGVCERLGRIACAQLEEPIQKGALAMLKALAKGEIAWANIETVKNYAEKILARLEEWQNLTFEDITNKQLVLLPSHALESMKAERRLLEKEQDKEQGHTHQKAILNQITGLHPGITALNITIDAVESRAQVQTIALPMTTIAQQIQVINAPRKSFDDLNVREMCAQSLRKAYFETLSNLDVVQEALAHYVAPEGQSIYSEERFDLYEKVQEFLSSDKKVLLLLGDVGSGKSTFTRHLEDSLWQVYESKIDQEKADQPIPLFIPLAQFPPSAESRDLIADYLKNKGLSEDKIEILRQHQSFIFIIDGFDEIKRAPAFLTHNKFGDWKRRKMIISSRPGKEYLGERHHTSFQERGQTNALQEYRFASLSDGGIEKYIKKYIKHSKLATGWSVQRYQDELDNLPDLKEAMRSPFLLRMALDILPTLIDSQEKTGPVTRIALYEQYIQRWALHAEEARTALLAQGFAQTLISASQAIAVALTQTGSIWADDEMVKALPFFADKSSEERRLLILNAPLVRDGGKYRFRHKSIQEYFVSRAICGPQSKSMTYPFEALPEREQSADDAKQFKQQNPLFNQLFVANEPVILGFLSERIHEQPAFRMHLHGCIEASKTRADLSIAAANAATALVFYGESFEGRNLANIKIPGANIRYGKFDGADLSGADMSGVTAIRTWFRNVNFTRANLSGIRFAEMPYIERKEKVAAFAYSPSGALLAIGWWEGELDIYLTATGKKILTAQGMKNRPYSMDFSADSRLLATVNDKGKVYVLNINNAQQSKELQEGRIGEIKSLNFSSDGKHIAAADKDGQICVWNSAQGTLISRWQAHTGAINQIRFALDGQYIVSAGPADSEGKDHQVCIWSNSGTLICDWHAHEKPVLSVDISADGRFVVSGSEDCSVCVWDIEKDKLLHTLKGHDVVVTSVRFSANDNHIVSADGEGTIHRWEILTGRLLDTVPGNHSVIDNTILSADARFAAMHEQEVNRVVLWEVNANLFAKKVDGHTQRVNVVSTAPKSSLAVSAADDGNIYLWDLKTAKRQGALSHPEEGSRGPFNDYINGVCLSNDGQYIASVGGRGRVVVWHAKTKQRLPQWQEGQDFEQWANSINFSNDGKRIAVAGKERRIWVWETETAKLLWKSEEEADAIHSVNFSADGRYLIAGSWNGKIFIWDTEQKYKLLSTSEKERVSANEAKQVYSVNFSPDGQYVVSGGEDKMVRIWKVTEHGSLEALETLKGHASSVSSVSFSPDGKFIASANYDKTVRVWRMKRESDKSSTCELVIKGSQDVINTVAWCQLEAQDDYALLVGDETGATILWQLRFPKTKEEKAEAHLVWTRGWPSLTLNDANLKGATGLSELNSLLLKQRGALNVGKKFFMDSINSIFQR